MKLSLFGSDNGKTVIYFHGAPGAPEECAIFDLYAKEQGLRFICFDRFSGDYSITGEAYYQLLAQEISKQAAGKQVDVIGFSIGAFIALQTCRYLGDGVRNLHLISAAAPLDAGDFLETMAGKQVFQLAKSVPILFVLLSYWQGLLAWLFPKSLFRLLFANAAGGDKALSDDQAFQSGITKVLRSCFTGRVRGYIRDIKAYVQPWKDTLSGIGISTHIWHGADDNWSPVAMAEYLQSVIPGCTSIEIFSGLSHYTCFCRAAPEICRQLGAASGGQFKL
ncbi:MAG TPA: alpha/beta hydrolase [Methylobacter sp.]